jgi:hypothetical protein
LTEAKQLFFYFSMSSFVAFIVFAQACGADGDRRSVDGDGSC